MTVLLRRRIGDVLREIRLEQRRTLREVSSTARVSLGYLSEVERGQKEASSELLASICEALNVPLSRLLRNVVSAVAEEEGRVHEADPGSPLRGHAVILPPAATKQDVAGQVRTDLGGGLGVSVRDGVATRAADSKPVAA